MVIAKLLDTAIDHFGRFGFEGASTRVIAKASGTAMSSITYHFGGKEGLYLAAADHIAATVTSMHAPAMGAARLAGESCDQSVIALLALIDNLAQMMLRPESTRTRHLRPRRRVGCRCDRHARVWVVCSR